MLSRSGLFTSSGVQLVTNTVDRTGIRAQFFDQEGTSLRSQYLGVDGSFSYTADVIIHRIHFVIPHSIIPSSGAFDLSCGMRTNAGGSILSCNVFCSAAATGAATDWTNVIGNSAFVHDNLGDMYMAPYAVELNDFGDLIVQVILDDTSHTEDGAFALRFEKVSSGATPVEVGNSFNTGDKTQQTAQNTQQISQNTQQLVTSQNETNGLLHDIIQHISDQLAAMWDQLYNIAFVPWMNRQAQQSQAEIDAQEQAADDITENATENRNFIIQAIVDLGNFIINGLKSLFIPSDNYFENVRTDLSSWFEQHFGFLAQSIDYFIRILNVFMVDQDYPLIRFPGISVPNVATGETYVILPARNVNLQTEMLRVGTFNWSDIFPDYYQPGGYAQLSLIGICKLVTSSILTLYAIKMFIDKLHKIEEM